MMVAHQRMLHTFIAPSQRRTIESASSKVFSSSGQPFVHTSTSTCLTFNEVSMQCISSMAVRSCSCSPGPWLLAPGQQNDLGILGQHAGRPEYCQGEQPYDVSQDRTIHDGTPLNLGNRLRVKR